MGSMNSNNWLSFPLSPTNSSLPAHLQTTQPHHFSLGLENENMEIPFQTHEWNLIDSQESSDVPKVADFLGVSKSENQSDLIAFNEIHPNNTDYGLFPITRLVPIQQAASAGVHLEAAAAASTNYDLQDNSNSLQSLTLSMGSGNGNGKGSTCETSGDNSANTSVEVTPRRTLDTFGQRTSIYRGVTRHRWTGRYEAHLWDNSCRREGQSRKGRQVYLGGYDKEEKAARAYDLAALKYWGTSTTTNFPISNYEKEVDEMKHMTRQEFVAAIRRKSSGFSRGASMYRGVTRHHQHGRWQARIGRVAGNKDLYLGTFSTEEEAAEAYDIAAIKFRGLNAVTNFDMSRYDVKSILESNTLPIGGGAAKRLKEAQAIESSRKREEMMALGGSSSSFQYGSGSSSSSRLHQTPYPLLQQTNMDHQVQLQTQPLLTLQNHDISHYTHQDPSSFHHQNYMQTQLQLHHQQSEGSCYNNNNNMHNQSSQFYNTYLQNHPALLHGMMNMGATASSSMIENYTNNNNNNAVGVGVGGYLGNAFGLASNSAGDAATNVGGSGEEFALVKVDYDMPSGGYGSWSGDSVQGSNTGVFSMWND